MILNKHEDVTPAVLEVMEHTADPRSREIMVSLIKHLHGFVRHDEPHPHSSEAATLWSPDD